MHVHIGAVEFLAFAAQYLILAFFLRWVTVTYPDSPIGKAVAYLTG